MSAIRNPGTVFEILQASFPLSEHMYHGCAHCVAREGHRDYP